MGKRKKRKMGTEEEGAGKASKKLKQEGTTGYKDIIKENEQFERYYKGQGFISPDEWDNFMSALRESLPVTFRITGTRSWAHSVLAYLQRKYFNELSGLEVEGERILPPHPLEWYPDNLAWHLSLSRKVIRKSPPLSKFHSFLVKESEQGNISRQEAVSMIPPLLLKVESHHNVIDLCAAPGSKTSQLIEALHQTTPTIPSGIVVANDADNKRCYMLVHQAKRLNSPCLMVTNHDASNFPVLYYHDESDVRHPLYFDRVLCDVPCSGDGTLRKNPTIWRTWNPATPLSLHRLQLRILVRGLELLRPGGRLVYSTCSLNPIEDEAVVCTAVKIGKGSIELVDCDSELTGLKRNKGLLHWKVMSKNGEWLTTFAETPPASSHMIQLSMFPPTSEEAAAFHLDRCIRILPHVQDTGGFFVAVFHKLHNLPWQNKTTPTCEAMPIDIIEEPQTEKDDLKRESATINEDVVENLKAEKPFDILGRPGFVKRKRTGFKEDPFVFLEESDPIIDEISSYYNLPESFPKSQFLTRTYTGKKKTIYLTSSLVKELTKRNKRNCKIINTGVRVFSRCEHMKSKCSFRLTQEGVDTMLPYISDCMIHVTLSDLITLLYQPNPLNTVLSNETQDLLKSFGTMRPVLFVYNPTGEKLSNEIEVQCPIYLSGWIAAKSVRLFVAHPERYHYLAILGETPPEELSLATRSAKSIVDPIDEEDMIGSAIAVDEVIDQGEKIDDERSETEEGGIHRVSSTVVERKDEEDTSTTIDDTTVDDN